MTDYWPVSGMPKRDPRLAAWNPFPGTQARLSGDWLRATSSSGHDLRIAHNWRVVPVVVGPGWRRWAIYRNGVRMWAKKTLPGALDYIRRHA